ncbi:hypothetical protein NFI96_030294, partial [Prochilodus magdalenae]
VLGSGRRMNCGTNEEKLIRPGDTVSLQCDCRMETGWEIYWVRSCSPLLQPMLLSSYESVVNPIPRYSMTLNSVNNSYNLTIENITESDLGLYYCARSKVKMDADVGGKLAVNEVYHICNTSTKLSYEVLTAVEPDCTQCWLILMIVCPVCTILSSLLSSICVFLCTRKPGVMTEPDSDHTELATKQQQSVEQNEDTQVYYASLNIPKGTSRRVKRKASVNPDFSLYSELNKRQDKGLECDKDMYTIREKQNSQI